MITKDEILKGKELNLDHLDNFTDLFNKINSFRAFFGAPMIVTSGYRTEADQLRIYKGQSRVPMGSKHLTAQAIDIYDPDCVLKDFINDNLDNPIIKQFWYEAFDCTPNWVHFQTVPPKSGNRFFYP